MEIVMAIVAIGFLIIVISAIEAIVWLVREFAVKGPRRRRWIDAHDGNLIGSQEFFAWCEKEGVDPGFYM